MKSKLEKPPRSEEEEQLDQALKEQGVLETALAVTTANCPEKGKHCKDARSNLMRIQESIVNAAKKRIKP